MRETLIAMDDERGIGGGFLKLMANNRIEWIKIVESLENKGE